MDTGPRPVVRTLAELDDEAFHILVGEEASGAASPNDAMLLRAPANAERWYVVLGQHLNDINIQLARRKAKYEEQQAGRFGQDMRKLHTSKYQEWRRKALSFKRALELRRAECAREAAEQKRLRHEQLSTEERHRYLRKLQEVLDFLSDDTIFVYSAWPRRDELKESIERTIQKEGT
jgi:hypothetical protein